MARRAWNWTPKQLNKLKKVIEVLNDLQDYKPLTLRQVFYQLVSKEYIKNEVSQYKMLSSLLKWARIDGYISWDDIEDRVRTLHDAEGWLDKSIFLSDMMEWLGQYQRNLWQTQDKYVEVWIEKDALSSVFTRVCSPYAVNVVVCKGFSSVSFLHDFTNRLKHDRDPVMLYFGDFDPSGVEMLTSMQTTLREEMGVDGIAFKRIALLRDDIFLYKLPHNPTALKRSDTRASKHLSTYGELAVELDALRPDILEQKISSAIELEITDIATFNSEVDTYNKEMKEMEGVKQRILEVV